MNSLQTRDTVLLGDRRWELHRLDQLGVDHLPFTLKVLLENLLRHEDGQLVTGEQVEAVRRWDPTAGRRDEVDLHPTRVFLHDTNGVPTLVDLAAMRDALASLGGDPEAVNPLLPAELVADHSVVADVFGRPDARDRNVELEHLDGMPAQPPPLPDIVGARVLVKLGDSITTDHISPAGAIPRNSDAGRYLASLGVPPGQLNTFASRRGNHEVMARGAFANVRLRNQLVPGTVGGVTRSFDAGGGVVSIYQAARTYRAHSTPVVVIAGRDYGAGFSRDWAAKGPKLLGVRAILAESFECIHRSNLIGMGILPLQFLAGQSAQSLGLTGEETITIGGLASAVADPLDARSRFTRTGPPSPRACGSTPAVKLTTTATVACCPMCSAAS